MWFVIGVLCGAALCGVAFLCLPKEKGLSQKRAKAHSPKGTHETWGQTRNFLYYDGTVMPEIKEESNEQ